MTKLFNNINKSWALATGILLIASSYIVKNAVQSPYILLHQTDALDLLPPLWLLTLLWYVLYFVSGFVAGHILSLACVSTELDVKRYQGGMFFVIAITLSFAWYLLLFGPELFFLSWIICGVAATSFLLTAFCWLRLGKNSFLILLSVSIAFYFLFIIQFFVMLHT